MPACDCCSNKPLLTIEIVTPGMGIRKRLLVVVGADKKA
jgi:hypothetical protein